MKKYFLNFGLMGAIALVGLVGFSACSDKLDELGGNTSNPISTVETKDIPVNFIFNVSTAATDAANTRMSDANTQALPTSIFRGIDHAHIFAFNVATPGNWVYDPGAGEVGGSEKVQKYYDFGTILASGQVNASPTSGSDATTPSSHRVVELSLPSGTNALMFYGKAIRTSADGGDQGYIDFDVKESLYDSKFSYVSRLQNNAKFTKVQNILAGILTGIIKTGLTVENKPKSGGYGGETPDTEDFSYWFWYSDEPQGDELTKQYIVLDNYNVNQTEFISATDKTNYQYTEYVYDQSTHKFVSTLNNTDKPATKTIAPETSSTTTYNYKLYHATLRWYDYGEANTVGGNSLKALEENLANAFNAITTIRTISHPSATDVTEFRGGSADDIKRTVHDLADVCSRVMNATPVNYQEAVAQRMAKRIFERINLYFSYTYGSTEISYQAINTITSNIKAYYDANNTGVLDIDGVSTAGDVSNFPDLYGVPKGGSLLLYTPETDDSSVNIGPGYFSYRTTLPNYDLGGGAATSVALTDYVYPAEIMYFGNGPIRVSDKSIAEGNFPNGYQNWLDDSNWNSTDGWNSSANTGVVSSSTNSVALKTNINYGTAMLKTSVRIVPGSGNVLKDNNSINGEGNTDRDITVSNTSFELTGIIIGAQPASVGWNYIPVYNESRTKMVYDSKINSTGRSIKIADAAPTEATQYNYTLLLDNYAFKADGTTGVPTTTPGAKADQQKVKVALELKNNAGDFWGNANLVRNGGTFYLIGELDPTTTADLAARTDGYAMPPYKKEGANLTTDMVNRVFMQDYVTTANFVIGSNSLKSAYVTVPDLHASQVSLGLSVDMVWTNGLTFDGIVLGN